MFDAKLHSKDYRYVRNRYVIPSGIEVTDIQAYLLHKLKQEYRDELLGVYLVWDTYNAEKKHEGKTYKIASGRLDFYIHVYVFTDFPNEKALAFRLGMKVRSDKEHLLWCSSYLNFLCLFCCSLFN